WVEINDVINALLGYARENRLDVGAVRVNVTDSVAVPYVLRDHVEHYVRLAGASLADDIKVPHAVFARQMDLGVATAIAVRPEENSLLGNFDRRGRDAGFC